jgi:hypothetical protein
MGEELTLSVQEVTDWDGVIALLTGDCSVLEHLIKVRLRSHAHVLLTKMLDMCVDVGMSKLLRERDLLERHLVDACAHRAEQRSCGKECALHDCDSNEIVSPSK